MTIRNIKHRHNKSPKMALPNKMKDTFSPQEIQFITENEHIQILPRYTMNSIDLITDEIPKLRAMHRVSVPLWFAVILKSQRKCSIVPPKWLNLSKLQELYQFEVSESQSFSALPYNWLELSKIFFDKAADDLQDEVHKLKSLIQDLKEIRLIKVKKGLNLVNESHLQLDNLSVMEINEIRPFVVQIMSKLTQFHEAAREADDQDEELAENYDADELYE